MEIFLPDLRVKNAAIGTCLATFSHARKSGQRMGEASETDLPLLRANYSTSTTYGPRQQAQQENEAISRNRVKDPRGTGLKRSV